MVFGHSLKEVSASKDVLLRVIAPKMPISYPSNLCICCLTWQRRIFADEIIPVDPGGRSVITGVLQNKWGQTGEQ